MNDSKTTMLREVLKRILRQREDCEVTLGQGRNQNSRAPTTPNKNYFQPRPLQNSSPTTNSFQNRALNFPSNSNNAFQNRVSNFSNIPILNRAQYQNLHSSGMAASRPQEACLLCNKTGHSVENCFNFTSLQARRSRLEILKRCTKCTRIGHRERKCRARVVCSNCRGEHSIVFCGLSEGRVNMVNATNSQNEEVPIPVDNIASVNTVHDVRNKIVLLKCVKCMVSSVEKPDREEEALIMFDDGSTGTYVSNAFVKRLELLGSPEHVVTFGVFGEPTSPSSKSSAVELCIRTDNGEKMKVEANTLDYLTQPVPHAIADEKGREEHVEGLWGLPDILIGSDQYYDFDIKTTKRLTSGVYVLSSRIGKMLGGKCATRKSNVNHVSENCALVLSNVLKRENNVTLNDLVDEHFSLERIGICEERKERDVLQDIRDTITHDGTRYEVKIPWKGPVEDIPSNFGLCVGRLRSVLKTLQPKPELMTKYCDIFKEQL